ncbi:hypothetical protein H2203_004716 [Taxawa tesnikishii (nom. ined.)]|nr:hypothetical protein H2203_004716 [Dothideales sp. JES 119]
MSHSQGTVIECELPERALVSGSQNNGFEDRLHRIEEIILRLSEAVFPQAASSSAPNGESRTPTNGAGTDSLPSNNYPRPVEIIRDLQYELLDERHESSDEHSKYMDVVSTGIITPQVASSLLHTSVERYGKWVSISNPDQLSESSPQGYALLKSVLCLLATRFHAEISVYSTQEIYHHVKRLTASAIIDTPSASLSVVQALTLLCMWSPAIRTEKPLDSWHLSGTTAGLAILAFKLGKPITITDKTPAQNLRIWSSLCLAHLQYSIGNGRPILITIPLIEQCSRLLDETAQLPFNEPLIAELSLYLALHKTLREQTGNSEADQRPDLEDWHSSWGHLLNKPGPPTTLQLGWWFSHLIQNRRTMQLEEDVSTEQKARALRESASIVSQFVRHNPARVADFPDFIFFIAGYASLVLCESAIDHHLVESMQKYLTRVAPNNMHIAYRHGQILQRALQRSLESESVNPGTLGHQVVADQDFLSTGLHDFDLTGFDVFGEYFTVDSLL